MSDYILTLEARDDLIAIQDFIAQDNPQAAARVVDECFELFSRLAKNPDIGHRRQDLTLKNVRFWNFYSYLIVYKSDTQPLAIVRILSGYRDISTVLQETSL